MGLEQSLAVVSVDGKDLGYSLIKNNLARPYDGGLYLCLKELRMERQDRVGALRFIRDQEG